LGKTRHRDGHIASAEKRGDREEKAAGMEMVASVATK